VPCALDVDEMSKAPVYATWDETGLGLNDIPTGIAITNPKIYINLPPGTQSMLRRGRDVVVEHICESVQAVASIFSHAKCLQWCA